MSYLEKMNEFRAEVNTLDWSDDKSYTVGGGIVRYLSIDKIKRNLAPLLVKHKILNTPRFDEVKFDFLESRVHVSVRLTMTVTDIETGEYEEVSVYGEGMDAGDKALAKAQTAAYKQWCLSYLNIADGLDADGSSPEVEIKTFKPSVKPAEEIRSKVLDAAAQSEPEQPKGEGVPLAHSRAMQKILDAAKVKASKGEMDAAEFNQLSSDFADAKDGKSALAFIKKYKEIKA